MVHCEKKMLVLGTGQQKFLQEKYSKLSAVWQEGTELRAPTQHTHLALHTILFLSHSQR